MTRWWTKPNASLIESVLNWPCDDIAWDVIIAAIPDDVLNQHVDPEDYDVDEVE